MQLIKQIMDAGQGILILDGNLVQSPIVNAHAHTVILLPHKQDWSP